MRQTRLSRGYYWRNGIIWTRVLGARCSTGERESVRAVEWRERECRRRADPRYLAAHETTFRHGAMMFVGEMRAAGRARATLEYYAGKFGPLLRHFGEDAPLALLDCERGAARVLAYRDARLTDGAKAFTVKKELGALGAMLRLMVHRGRFARDPALLMPPFFRGGHVSRERYLEPWELFALAVRGRLPPHRLAWVCLNIAMGGRDSEVHRARVEDFDLDGGRMRVRGTKTAGAERWVAMPGFAVVLARWALAQGAGTGGLVVRKWSRGSRHRDLRLACARAELAPVSSNDLRRTHGTWLVQAGVPIAVGAFQLRNSSKPATIATAIGRATGLRNQLSHVRIVLGAPDYKAIREPSTESVTFGVTDLAEIRAKLAQFGREHWSFHELLDDALGLGADAALPLLDANTSPSPAARPANPAGTGLGTPKLQPSSAPGAAEATCAVSRPGKGGGGVGVCSPRGLLFGCSRDDEITKTKTSQIAGSRARGEKSPGLKFVRESRDESETKHGKKKARGAP